MIYAGFPCFFCFLYRPNRQKNKKYLTILYHTLLYSTRLVHCWGIYLKSCSRLVSALTPCLGDGRLLRPSLAPRRKPRGSPASSVQEGLSKEGSPVTDPNTNAVISLCLCILGMIIRMVGAVAFSLGVLANSEQIVLSSLYMCLRTG